MAGFWGAIGEIVAAGAAVAYGKEKVRNIVSFKMSAAMREVDSLVVEIVASQNKPLMAAVLDEFGNQFQAAETREAQDDVNELLWYFKERFTAQAAEQRRIP